jgi:hypothetical protein
VGVVDHKTRRSRAKQEFGSSAQLLHPAESPSPEQLTFNLAVCRNWKEHHYINSRTLGCMPSNCAAFTQNHGRKKMIDAPAFPKTTIPHHSNRLHFPVLQELVLPPTTSHPKPLLLAEIIAHNAMYQHPPRQISKREEKMGAMASHVAVSRHRRSCIWRDRARCPTLRAEFATASATSAPFNPAKLRAVC